MVQGHSGQDLGGGRELVAEVLSLERLSVSFGPVQVLKDVSLRLAAGEVLGLVGHNGSGKSTIAKVLAGYHAPHEGSLLSVRGEDIPLPLDPAAQIRLGLTFVHQDLALVEAATVWENIGIGQYQTAALGRVDAARERRLAVDLLRSLGCDASPNRQVVDLPAPDQARVAIARALRRLRALDAPGVLILDEATNFFDKRGAAAFLGRLKEYARESGTGIIVIGHRFDELVANCDRIVVLRDGRIVGEVTGEDSTEENLIDLMLGRHGDRAAEGSGAMTAALREAVRARTGAAGRDRALRVESLKPTQDAQELSFEIPAGTVVGLTGLRGMGWEETVRAVGGDIAALDGRLVVDHREFPALRWNAHRAVSSGVAYVPAEQTRGGIFEATAADNLWMPSIGRFVHGPVLRWRAAIRLAREKMRTLAVVPPEPAKVLSTFSGGNRQKVIVGRWLVGGCRYLVLDEPTQGVDVKARNQLIASIRNVAEAGVGVLVASQDARDLAAMCDRLLVMNQGEVVAELAGQDLNPDRIALACYGRVDQPAPARAPMREEQQDGA